LPETFARTTRIGLYIIEAIDESLTSKQKQIQQKKIARKNNGSERITDVFERVNNRLKNGMKNEPKMEH
jgi:hypothetical protein